MDADIIRGRILLEGKWSYFRAFLRLSKFLQWTSDLHFLAYFEMKRSFLKDQRLSYKTIADKLSRSILYAYRVRSIYIFADVPTSFQALNHQGIFKNPKMPIKDINYTHKVYTRYERPNIHPLTFSKKGLSFIGHSLLVLALN